MFAFPNVCIFLSGRWLLIHLPDIKLLRNPPFAAIFSFKSIKPNIYKFKFGNNVKHNAEHINQPKIKIRLYKTFLKQS